MIRSKKLNPQKIEFNFPDYREVKITETNTQIQVQCNLSHYRGNNIEKIDAEHYRVKRTGVIKEFNHTNNRSDSISSLSQSMKKLRDLINTNVEDISKVTWLTLTYKENMQDEKRLYDDFRKFIMRLRYYGKNMNLPHFEYICAIEYQARGALHCHVLLIWENLAPFIPNDTMKQIWSHGFTKTKSLKGTIANVGNYLTAYLTDLPLHDAICAKTDLSKHDIKDLHGKKYVKASRLHLYPVNTKLYRCSRGIKPPKTYKMSLKQVNEILDKNDAELSWETLLWLYDDTNKNGFSNLIKYKYYDITPCAKARVKLIKSYYISKFYRTLYNEMISISLEIAMLQDMLCTTDELTSLTQRI